MNWMRSISATLVVVAFWFVATPAAAEVGAITGTEGQVASSVIYLGIREGPDPMGAAVWQRYSAPDDPRRRVLNEEGYANGDGRPSILVVPSTGIPVVAWARQSASGFDIVLSRFTGGVWSEPEIVAATSPDELDPHLFYDPATDTVHLVYWIADSVWRVVHQQAPADLAGWSAPEVVSGSAEAACRPWGVVHDGVVRVVYEVHPFGMGQTPREIVLARRELGGFVEEVVAVSSYDGELWPTVGSHAGRLWVDWVDSAGEVAWARLGLDGRWEATRYEPYTTAFHREFHVRPAIRVKVTEP